MENQVKTQKVSQAEILRRKQAKETISHHLSLNLIDFKERYLKSYVNFMNSRFDIELKEAQDLKFQGEKHFYTEEMFNRDKEARIQRIEKQKSLVFTNTLKFITEANISYNQKFERLVIALVDHGVLSYPLHIEKIGGGTVDDFAFLITHNKIVVHARVIFAHGPIKAPHYRFIITKRQNKEE